jgi:ribonuclease D
MTWQLIETNADLQALLVQASACEAVVIDTEFMRRNTFFPQVALLQLAFDDGSEQQPHAWLVDPLNVDDIDSIRELMANERLIKVLHSPSEDLEVFSRWLGVLPQPLFDTQKAAALLNMGFGMGFRALVLEMLGVDLPKGETRSDWLQRPLSAAQCEYAALDVTCLQPVWRKLRDIAQAQGKYEWVMADGDDMIRAAQAPTLAYYLKMKGAWKLAPDQLQVLAALCEWREATARLKDKPRGWILDDNACLQLAQQLPTSQTQLSAVEDVPPVVVRKHGDKLLDLITRAGDVNSAPTPALSPPLDAAGRGYLKKIKQRARAIAQEIEVAPEAILPSKDYELLIREAMGQPVETPAHWAGWRFACVIEPLRKHAMELVS